MQDARFGHTATLLKNGKGLVGGGSQGIYEKELSSVEIYSPACITKSDCLDGFCVDGFCCDTECTGKCQAYSFVKKGGGADGVCGPILAGQDPDEECPQENTATY